MLVIKCLLMYWEDLWKSHGPVALGLPQTRSHLSGNLIIVFHHIMILIFIRYCFFVLNVRQQYKREGIMELLSRSITTSHTIYPSFGHAEFFEFVLKNPFATEATVMVQYDDNELM